MTGQSHACEVSIGLVAVWIDADGCSEFLLGGGSIASRDERPPEVNMRDIIVSRDGQRIFNRASFCPLRAFGARSFGHPVR